MKSSLFMVKCLLLFTRFCRDEISSLDKLIPVKKTGMKFHPERKKRRVNTSSRDEIFKWACFFFIFILDICIQICFPKLTCLIIIVVWIQWNRRPLYKKWNPKKERVMITSKKWKMSKLFYYFFNFLWEVYKRLNFLESSFFKLYTSYWLQEIRNLFKLWLLYLVYPNHWKPFKNDEKCFFFHLKNSFRSRRYLDFFLDIYVM